MTKHRYDREATRRELIASARAQFAKHGYTATRTEEIARLTGLTRGALYHHFSDKKGIFRAVLEGLQDDLTGEVIQRAREIDSGSIERLRAGFHAYLDLALRNDVRQILYIDGPAVLGWEDWRAIDLQHAFRITQVAIERAISDGEIEPVPIEGLTHVLLGALTHASLEVGRASEPVVAREVYREVMDFMLDKLKGADPDNYD
ncbi:MAG: TetR/AcrR family transcriptional regulator [Rhodospirillaceae bacterium]|nr:TetR/AcrR family transcriptional regulator [Rhodospirillaceae bacterium]MBT4690625.1 TetR/AcrR family transcriptional regulator [Rhodospirillaceae bacterium]MBT5080579.1 TetR/AcrR family transcriptional regulator [Rhodospirillaceae bacterium]MBT5526552.1 TetR/AcrR family transcriptional regulator [Rhodospirillaceae bacterium]MBT5877499.1 TetR/AcrR family transcriptional regulator [Rhodospirillaceae bacterium]